MAKGLNTNRHAPDLRNYDADTQVNLDFDQTLRGLLIFGPGVLEFVTARGDTVTMTYGTVDFAAGTAEVPFCYPHCLKAQVKRITSNTTVAEANIILML